MTKHLDKLLEKIAKEPLGSEPSKTELEFLEKVKELRIWNPSGQSFDFDSYVKYIYKYNEVQNSK